MGLSEPRKRLKIGHDPRNLSWSTAAPSSSVGHRLMTSQGWSEGQALGARTPSTGTSTPTITSDDATRLAMSKVGMLFKDDTLGLGAKLKSKDVEGQRTGLDAFQSVLGRLNSKTEEELEKHVEKESERKLERYATGRWGGMMFVPGGVLVQGEGFKSAQEGIEEKRRKAEQKSKDETGPEDVVGSRSLAQPKAQAVDEKAEKKRRKEERRRRKEERRLRKAAKADAEEQPKLKKSRKASKSASVSAPDEATSSSDDEEAGLVDETTEQSKGKQSPSVVVTETIKKDVPRSGRHILRGRNIDAKRKAFSDTKGLDAIFMR